MVEAGNEITAIDGAPLKRSRDFAKVISKMAPGSVFYLTTFRNGELMRSARGLAALMRAGIVRSRSSNETSDQIFFPERLTKEA